MIVFRSVCVSPHLNSLCRGIFERFRDFMFVYKDADQGDIRIEAGWSNVTDFPSSLETPEWRTKIQSVEVLIDMVRDLDLFESRVTKGLLTFYTNERWFKPIGVKLFGHEFLLPGFLRMLHPRYFRMALRFSRLMCNEHFVYLPIGIHAARDMARVCGLFRGDLRCLFRAPHLEFERKPGGRISSFRNMFMWGYFVEPSGFPRNLRASTSSSRSDPSVLRVLWVGRMLYLKRVDTIIEAVKQLKNTELNVYGRGEDCARLKTIASGCGRVHFFDYVRQDKVRELMRSHDVYVFSSDGRDGWGAVVSEAMTEDMAVIGTRETGAASTMLPDECLYRAGDDGELVRRLNDARGLPRGYFFDGKNAGMWICDMIERFRRE